MIAALFAAAALHAAPPATASGQLWVGSSSKAALTWRAAPGAPPRFDAYPYRHPEDQDLTVFGPYHSVTICPANEVLTSYPPQLACQRWDRESGQTRVVYCNTSGGDCR